MSVMVTTRIPGLPAETYDGIVTSLEQTLRGATGFVAHAGLADDDGVTVIELWDEEDDWRRFFETNVQSNLPPGLPAPEIVSVRRVLLAGP